MISKVNFFSLLTSSLIILAGCSTLPLPVKQTSVPTIKSSCHIVYDAGSSGTRLFIYEQQGDGWSEHVGPKVSALADPVREIRGKKISDIDAVTAEVVTALDSIKQPGPLDEEGKVKWQAFDWPNRCQISSAMVYATAGMRIAEQEDRENSARLWQALSEKLKTKVGQNVDVSARTLTGYEEGLYAWLAVRGKKQVNNFGIAEMGGASSQVTFPCPTCKETDEDSKTVLVDGAPLKIFSYSFLGLGQDEAPKVLGNPQVCSYGIGSIKPNWKANDCAKRLVISDTRGIRDPYDYNGRNRGTYRQIPTDRAEVTNWVLTGAFNYLDENQVKSCCHEKGQCFNEETSCFRAVYLDKYLKTLNIPKNSEKMDVSWTQGAVICKANNCLQNSTAPSCHWSDKGCLTTAD